MTKTFKCPSCGGPIDYAGGDAPTVRCPFCSNSVIVPPELRFGQAAGAASAPPPAVAPVAPTAPGAPATPEELRAKLKEARHAAREQRRTLRHQLHEARHRSRHQ